MERGFARELYQRSVEQEQYYLNAHHIRLSTYLGFASALIVATIAGAIEATGAFETSLLCSGPVLVFAVARIGLSSCARFYQRFLETITMRAKLECELELDKPRNHNGHWSATAPIVSSRHLNDRYESKSEAAFIDTGKLLGEQLVATRLFLALQWLAGLLLMALIVRVFVLLFG